MLGARLPSPESLSLREQVAQMMVVRTSGHLFDHQLEYPQWEASQAQLQRYLAMGVGGVILLGGSAAEVGMRTQQLQSWAKYPLLMAADIEEGVGQRFSGATWFPPPLALSAIARQDKARALYLAERMGAITAEETTAMGLNWILAPVVDINNNPNNPVISLRAFGENPEEVSDLAMAFLQGTQGYPVLTCAKHFPGHGDTAVDSHLNLPVMPHDFERLQRLELVPFQRAIAAGIDSVMTAHLSLPKLDPDYPSTLSKLTLTGLLRQDMGFDGLIVTDALVMGSITERYGGNQGAEAAVMAVEAGADLLMMPADVEAAIAAICEAVGTGRLKSAAILRAVERIWRAKHKISDLPVTDSFSRHAWQQQAVPPLEPERIATPEARAIAADILQQSQQVINGPRQSLGAAISAPLIPGQNLVIVDEVLHCPFLSRTCPALTLPARQGYELTLVDSRSAEHLTLNRQATTLLQLFIRSNPFRSGRQLQALALEYIEALGPNLQAVVVYGSPYVWQAIQAHLPPHLPGVFTYGQMPEAQAIALQALLSPGAKEPEPGPEKETRAIASSLETGFTD